MIRCTRLCLLLAFLPAFLFTGAGVSAFAAKPKDGGSSLPKDPAALLALAAQHNGLAGPGLKPWHIKAMYQVYNAKGNVTGKGSFEEWWASPDEYKTIFNGPRYKQQVIRNANGTFVSGGDTFPYPEYLVQDLYDEPVNTKLPGKGMKLHFNMEHFGKTALACVEEIPKGLQPTGFHSITNIFPTYCMDPAHPILLLYGSYGQTLTQLTAVASLDGRYLVQNAVIFDNGHELLSVHLTQGETASQWSPKLFLAPSDAQNEVAFSKAQFKDAKVIAGYRISGQPPDYPESAKIGNVQGKVVLRVLIGRDGVVRSLVILSAPSISLATSAVGAVKTWKYKPYLLGGRPVRVVTIIKVTYSLGI